MSTQTRDGRPATVTILLSQPVQMALSGQYCGPVGLVRKFAAASSRGARGLIPGRPRPRPSRVLLTALAATKIARPLHYDLVEPIAGGDGFIGILGGLDGYAAPIFGQEVALSSD